MEQNEIYRFISELTNSNMRENRRKLIAALRELHPTQQQVFAGMVLAWINDFAENVRIDDRNRSSHRVCERLVELYRAYTGQDTIKIKDEFPMV